MIERFVDKKIKVLEEVCEDNFKSNSASDYGIEISEQGFIQIVEEFQSFGWLKISHISPLDISGIETEYEGKTLIHYQIINKKGLSDLLLKLKKEYPKLSKPNIQEKSLELIARDMGEFDTGVELIRFLKKCGVEEQLIIYPNTKWRMIYDILVYLSYSARPKDCELLLFIITESIHPLIHNGDWEKSKQLCEKFNKYLFYDNYEIHYSTDDKKYKITYEPTDEEMNEIQEQVWEEECKQQEVQAKNDRIFYEKTENKKRIEILKKTYQIFINIIETFCQNPTKPSHELNDAYLKTYAILKNITHKLETTKHTPIELLGFSKSIYFPLFSSNLFGAESLFNRRNEKLCWESIRPKMNDTYGEIEDIFRHINGSDILSEPDIQKTLNDVSLIVSETKKKNESLKIKSQKQALLTHSSTIKVEIAEMPELKIKGMSEEPNKNIKKIRLAKVRVDFNDDEVKIIAGKAECPLPPFKNEHFFCRSMFKHLPKEFIDWSIIYNEMENIEPTDKIKNKRAIQDTMYAVNNRIKDVFPTDDDLFTWKEKSVARNY